MYASPSYLKLFQWGKLVSITGSAQFFIQAIGLVSGIIVIRLLPTQQYGLYTLANTMLGTMMVLADGGISTTVMAQGGKVWQNRVKLGAVIATGIELRRKFAIASLLVATPVLFYLLMHNNAGWLASLLISAALMPAFFAALSGNLLSIAPSLHQAVVPLQKLQVSVSVGRLGMILLTLFIFPWASIAILCASLPQVLANLHLRRVANLYADSNQPADPVVRANILTGVRRILPGSIYYCLSGQITIWLISLFGTTASLAQAGALGRLTMVLGLFTAVFVSLVVPRFARLEGNQKLLLKRFVQLQFGLIPIFTAIVLIVSIFPGELLWILGRNYAGLHQELLLSVAGGCMSVFAGLLFTLATSRNWTIHPAIVIPITIAALITGILIFDISSLAGILRLNLWVSFTEVLIYMLYCFFRIHKMSV